MAKRKTKKYHKKRNTYKRRQTYKRKNTYKKRKRTNRKKLTGGATYAANVVKSIFGVTPKINYDNSQLEYFKSNFSKISESKKNAIESGTDELKINYNKGDVIYEIPRTIYDGSTIYTQASFDALKLACG